MIILGRSLPKRINNQSLATILNLTLTLTSHLTPTLNLILTQTLISILESSRKLPLVPFRRHPLDRNKRKQSSSEGNETNVCLYDYIHNYPHLPQPMLQSVGKLFIMFNNVALMLSLQLEETRELRSKMTSKFHFHYCYHLKT